ncbi:2-amino-4-hydroxy-6-hydroxymethyldihydropteridine diphosphokinase [Rhodobacteraceae bacterium NNCM2]|nr:2-amino-4-hydroxy-6-hydroxymethyldihydropteridine diphosphokinase [Coraliihabitans acroporae]
MTLATIALGANLPVVNSSLTDTLSYALESLSIVDGINVLKTSKWYRSPAFPPGSGPDFVNGAALIETEMPPCQILAQLHDIESLMGRERPARWAPRVCDLDLIYVGDTVLPDRETLAEWMAIDLGKAQTVTPPHLILPHPRLHERAFVLVPLNDITPDWRHPMLGRSVSEMVSALPPDQVKELVPLPA